VQDRAWVAANEPGGQLLDVVGGISVRRARHLRSADQAVRAR
jgi:hypothetical protein